MHVLQPKGNGQICHMPSHERSWRPNAAKGVARSGVTHKQHSCPKSMKGSVTLRSTSRRSYYRKTCLLRATRCCSQGKKLGSWSVAVGPTWLRSEPAHHSRGWASSTCCNILVIYRKGSIEIDPCVIYLPRRERTEVLP